MPENHSAPTTPRYLVPESANSMSVHFRRAVEPQAKRCKHIHTDRFAPIRTLRTSFHSGSGARLPQVASGSTRFQ